MLLYKNTTLGKMGGIYTIHGWHGMTNDDDDDGVLLLLLLLLMLSDT